MKTLKITRTHASERGTFGEFELFADGAEAILRGKTCEPAGEPTEQAKQNRPILPGSYKARFVRSAKFSPRTNNRLLPLISSDFCDESRHILIHAGNWAKDTIGCILVGEYFLYDDEEITGVAASKKTLYALLDELDEENFKVEIC